MKSTRKNNKLLTTSLILNAFFLILTIVFIVRFGDTLINRIFPEKEKSKTIAMLGNSLTAGGNWNLLLSRNDVINVGTGHGGFTTSHYVFLLENEVIRHRPKICFIEGGINDISVGIPLQRVKGNIQSLIDTLKVNKIIPVLTMTFHTSFDTAKNKMVDSLNKIINELATKNGVQLIDLNKELSENGFLKKSYTTDGTHLNDSAYPIWARKVKEVLVRNKI